MSKELTIFIITSFLIISATLFLKNKSPSDKEGIIKGDNSQNEVILFVSITCPHCKIVEEWLDNKPDIKKKSRLETKEVNALLATSQLSIT